MAKLEIDNIELANTAISGDIFFASIQTSDATPTTLLELEVPDENVITFTAIVSAKGPTNKNYWIKIDGGVRRTSAGSAVLIGTPAETFDDENTPGYTAAAVVSGNFLRIQVTGASAETVDWDGKIMYSVPASHISNSDSQLQYYDHSFTWTTGAVSAVKHVIEVTHNVGRPPDKVVVYVDGINGWYEHSDLSSVGGGTTRYGWDCWNQNSVDENNIQTVRFYTNQNNQTRTTVIRLIWFPMDTIEGVPTTGLKVANFGKSQGLAVQTGVEVKTADTHNGKPVYFQEVDFGNLPNATTKIVAHGITIDEVVSYQFIIYYPPSDYWMNIAFASGLSPRFYIFGTNLYCITASNYSAYTGKARIFYTKP
jgi:hypothetical protein